MFDKDDPQLKRFSIIPDKIPSIEELLGTTIATGNVNCADFQKTGTVKDVFLCSEIMTLIQPYNKVTLKSNSLHVEVPPRSHFSVTLGLYKENEAGVFKPYEENIISAHDYNVSNNTRIINSNIHGSEYDVPAGRYKMSIKFDLDDIPTLQLQSLSMSFIANVDVRRIEFGTNGFMAFYNHGGKKNFVKATENDGVQIGGKTDIPGILASGSSSKYGMLDRTFGKIHRVEKTTDGYRIYHNIGHGEFSVQITPHLLGSGQRNNDGFNIKAVDHNVVDIVGYGGFDFALIGKNYV